MEEKMIIQGKNQNAKLIRNVIFGIGVVLGLIAAMLYADANEFHYEGYWSSSLYGNGDGLYDPEEFLGEMFSVYGILCFAGAFAVALIVGLINYFATRNIELTVTDKRVYGIAAFGKRVDLPLDSISSVGTGLNKIAVATSSGRIIFWGVSDREKIHKALSTLLIARQTKSRETPTIKQQIPQSNADELRKYKELLDSGVITQEEFDAKKKQLLGL